MGCSSASSRLAATRPPPPAPVYLAKEVAGATPPVVAGAVQAEAVVGGDSLQVVNEITSGKAFRRSQHEEK